MTTSKEVSLSIVIPTYKSGTYIQTHLREIANFFNSVGLNYEIVVVVDGSKDNTLQKCLDTQSEFDDKFKVINLIENYGQIIATNIGFEAATGKYVVTFDDDLQYEIKDILTFYENINTSKSWVVTGYYNTYSGTDGRYGLLRKTTLFFLNYIFFAPYRNKKFFTSFKIFNKDELKKQGVFNIFYFWNIPAGKINSIRVVKKNRAIGKSNYNPFNYFRALSHILYYSILKSILFFLLPLYIIISLILNWEIRLSILIIFFAIIVILLMKLNFDKKKYRQAKMEIYS